MIPDIEKQEIVINLKFSLFKFLLNKVAKNAPKAT